MSKVTLTDITKVDSTVISAVNANNAAIEAEFDNCLSLDGTSPNTMAADIDMDGNTLLNLPAATAPTNPVRLQDLDELLDLTTASAVIAECTADVEALVAAADATIDAAVASATSTVNTAATNAVNTINSAVSSAEATITQDVTDAETTLDSLVSTALAEFLAALSTNVIPCVAGLTLTNNASVPDTRVDITITRALLANASGAVVPVGAGSFTVNCATVGANGLDTGSLANSTWYYIWLVSDGTNTAGLASTSSTSPTMPSGYTYKVRLGAICTNASAQFKRIQQKGNRAVYVVGAGTTVTALPAIQSGATGNVSTPTWTQTAVTSFVPTTALSIQGLALSNGITMVAPNNSYGAYTSTANPPPVLCANSVTTDSERFDMLLESTSIYIATNNANCAVYCIGWTDSVAAV